MGQCTIVFATALERENILPTYTRQVLLHSSSEHDLFPFQETQQWDKLYTMNWDLDSASGLEHFLFFVRHSAVFARWDAGWHSGKLVPFEGHRKQLHIFLSTFTR
jgi:hypothetical protein